MRVIADHARATTFLVGDGVLPSNEGRGYVLRRILRRAMRHAAMLGARDPVMFRLVPALVRQMGAAYPETRGYLPFITKVAQQEEESFRRILDNVIAHPLGYRFVESGREVGAADLNGVTKTVFAPRAGGTREAVFAGSLALSILWDPATL